MSRPAAKVTAATPGPCSSLTGIDALASALTICEYIVPPLPCTLPSWIRCHCGTSRQGAGAIAPGNLLRFGDVRAEIPEIPPHAGRAKAPRHALEGRAGGCEIRRDQGDCRLRRRFHRNGGPGIAFPPRHQ